MNICKYIVYKLGPQVKKKFNSMSIEHNKKNAHKKEQYTNKCVDILIKNLY